MLKDNRRYGVEIVSEKRVQSKGRVYHRLAAVVAYDVGCGGGSCYRAAEVWALGGGGVLGGGERARDREREEGDEERGGKQRLVKGGSYLGLDMADIAA